MKVTIEINNDYFRSKKYDFLNGEGQRIEGTQYLVNSNNGFTFKFKNEDEFNKLKNLSDSKKSIPCTLDKYGRLFLKED